MALLFIINTLIFCISHSNTTTNLIDVQEYLYQNDSIKKPSSAYQNIECKPFHLDFSAFNSKEGFYKSKPLSLSGIKKFKIEEFDMFYDKAYKYHVLDTVCTSSKANLLLIARYYENENIVWLCKFDLKGKLGYFEQVFYDNAEGNFLIESKFDKKTLTIYTDDINEGKSIDQYKLSGMLNLIVKKK